MINSFTKWMLLWREREDLEELKKCNSDLFMLANIVFETKRLIFTKIDAHTNDPANDFAHAATRAMIASDKSCVCLDQ